MGIETDYDNKEIIAVFNKQVKIFRMNDGKLKRVYSTFFHDLSHQFIKYERDEYKRLFFFQDNCDHFLIVKEIDFLVLHKFVNPNFKTFFVLKGENMILFITKLLTMEIY